MVKVHDVEDHSKTSEVDHLIVSFASDNLRRHVARGPALGCHYVLGNESGKAKVGDFDDRAGVASGVEEVLGFEVSVGDAHVVAVSQGVSDGPDCFRGLFL